MGTWGNAVYRVACCVVLCSVVLSLFPEGKMKELLHTFFGIFLTVIFLSSVSGMELPDLKEFSADYLGQAQTAVSAGEDYTRYQYRELIKERLEAYILDIAESNGWHLTVHVEVDEDGCPVSAALRGEISSDERRTLESIISKDLGIAKEDQQWNGS